MLEPQGINYERVFKLFESLAGYGQAKWQLIIMLFLAVSSM
jgi:hypothetical protein